MIYSDAIYLGGAEINNPTIIRINAMTTGIAVMFAVLLVLPTQSSLAAGHVGPMMRPASSRVTPTGAHVDPRIAEFNRELAAYKQTVAALRRDSRRLIAQQKRIDALVSDIDNSAQLNMIRLQSIVSQRQTAIQLTSNMMKALNDSNSHIVHNMK